jgi:hypothetical protein
MTQNGGEWSGEPAGYGQERPSYSGGVSRGVVPKILGGLLAVIALGWVVACLWYINRTIGWQTIPQLLPHEIGGLIAGVLAPPAVLFALAA